MNMEGQIGYVEDRFVTDRDGGDAKLNGIVNIAWLLQNFGTHVVEGAMASLEVGVE